MLFSVVSFFTAKSQIDSEGVKLDLLKAPSSPASNLLGIAASDIDKPTDVSAFMLSLQKGTGNYTALPSNYAIDLAPYWLFKKKMGDVSSEGLKKSKGSDVFKQTFVVSFAIRNTDSSETVLKPNTVYGGLGFKFSIFRGDYDKQTIKQLGEIKKWQDIQLSIKNKSLADYTADVSVIELQARRKNLIKEKFRMPVDSTLKIAELDTDIAEITNALEKRLLELNENTNSDAKAKIKEVAASFQTARVGFTWDVSGGISAQFLNRRFDNSKVYNAGVWTTLGYTGEKSGSLLFLGRLLYNPDEIFAKDNGVYDIGNIFTFDFGGRYIYSFPQSKFNASMEGVYRSVLSSNTLNPSWRVVFNADYSIWENQKLTFSFGRNFDGAISKDGNLIAALTFLKGFGNKR